MMKYCRLVSVFCNCKKLLWSSPVLAKRKFLTIPRTTNTFCAASFSSRINGQTFNDGGFRGRLRPAEISDKGDVMEIAQDGYSSQHEKYRDDYLSDRYETYISHPSNIAVVCENMDDGRVVSFGFASLVDAGHTLVYRGARTLTRYQSRGLNSRLRQYLTQWVVGESEAGRGVERGRSTYRVEYIPKRQRMPSGTTLLYAKEYMMFEGDVDRSAITTSLSSTDPDSRLMPLDGSQLETLLSDPPLLSSLFHSRPCVVAWVPYDLGYGRDNSHFLLSTDNPMVLSDLTHSASFGTYYRGVDEAYVLVMLDLYHGGEGGLGPATLSEHILHHLLCASTSYPGASRVYLQIIHDCVDAGGREVMVAVGRGLNLTHITTRPGYVLVLEEKLPNSHGGDDSLM